MVTTKELKGSRQEIVDQINRRQMNSPGHIVTGQAIGMSMTAALSRSSRQPWRNWTNG